MTRSLKVKVSGSWLVTLSILLVVMFMLIVNSNAAVATSAHSNDVVNCPQLPTDWQYVQNCLGRIAKCSFPIFTWMRLLVLFLWDSLASWYQTLTKLQWLVIIISLIACFYVSLPNEKTVIIASIFKAFLCVVWSFCMAFL